MLKSSWRTNCATQSSSSGDAALAVNWLPGARHGRPCTVGQATTRLPRSMSTPGGDRFAASACRESTATRARRPTPRMRARERSSPPSSPRCTRSATASSGTRRRPTARRPARTSRLPGRSGARTRTSRASSAVPSSPGHPQRRDRVDRHERDRQLQAAAADPDARRGPHLRVRTDRAAGSAACRRPRPATHGPPRPRPRRRAPTEPAAVRARGRARRRPHSAPTAGCGCPPGPRARRTGRSDTPRRAARPRCLRPAGARRRRRCRRHGT